MSARVDWLRGVLAALLAAAALASVVPSVAQAQPSGGSGGGKVTCEAPGGGQVEAGDEVTVKIRDKKTGKVVAQFDYICGNDGKMHEIGIKGRVPAGRAVSTTVVIAKR